MLLESSHTHACTHTTPLHPTMIHPPLPPASHHSIHLRCALSDPMLTCPTTRHNPLVISTVPCSTVPCSPVQGHAHQYRAMLTITGPCSPVQCYAHQYRVRQYSAMLTSTEPGSTEPCCTNTDTSHRPRHLRCAVSAPMLTCPTGCDGAADCT
jgi:hypothetical protein